MTRKEGKSRRRPCLGGQRPWRAEGSLTQPGSEGRGLFLGKMGDSGWITGSLLPLLGEEGVPVLRCRPHHVFQPGCYQTLPSPGLQSIFPAAPSHPPLQHQGSASFCIFMSDHLHL